jgi:hypothetical protein
LLLHEVLEAQKALDPGIDKISVIVAVDGFLIEVFHRNTTTLRGGDPQYVQCAQKQNLHHPPKNLDQ